MALLSLPVHCTPSLHFHIPFSWPYHLPNAASRMNKIFVCFSVPVEVWHSKIVNKGRISNISTDIAMKMLLVGGDGDRVLTLARADLPPASCSHALMQLYLVSNQIKWNVPLLDLVLGLQKNIYCYEWSNHGPYLLPCRKHNRHTIIFLK